MDSLADGFVDLGMIAEDGFQERDSGFKMAFVDGRPLRIPGQRAYVMRVRFDTVNVPLLFSLMGPEYVLWWQMGSLYQPGWIWSDEQDGLFG